MHNMCEELTSMYQTAQQNDAPGDVLNEILKLRNRIRLRRDELSRLYREIDGNDNV